MSVSTYKIVALPQKKTRNLRRVLEVIASPFLKYTQDLMEAVEKRPAKFQTAFFKEHTNLTTNENQYAPVVENLERAPKQSVYVGTSALQNLTFIAQTQPDIALIVDLNPFISARMTLVFEAIRHSETPEAFISFLDNHIILLANIIQHNSETYPLFKDQEPASFIKDFNSTFILDLGNKYRTLSEEIGKLTDNPNELWLKSQEQYDRIRTMVCEGRIKVVWGNFTDVKRFKEFQETCHTLGLSIHTLYVSNIGDYLKDEMADRFKSITESLDPAITLFSKMCDADFGEHGKLQVIQHRKTVDG